MEYRIILIDKLNKKFAKKSESLLNLKNNINKYLTSQNIKYIALEQFNLEYNHYETKKVYKNI